MTGNYDYFGWNEDTIKDNIVQYTTHLDLSAQSNIDLPLRSDCKLKRVELAFKTTNTKDYTISIYPFNYLDYKTILDSDTSLSYESIQGQYGEDFEYSNPQRLNFNFANFDATEEVSIITVLEYL